MMSAAMNQDETEVETTETVRTEFRIRDERKAWFVGEMARLAKRAAKIGVPAPTFTFGQPEDVEEEAREEVGEDPLTGRPVYQTYPVIRRYWPCTIAGEAPKFAGWSIVATIEVLVEGDKREVLVRSITSEALPAKYRDARGASNCDHCKAWRARRETFVVRHDSGELKQVGRQCIRDFLGHKSPEHFASWAEFILTARELAGGGETYTGGGEERFPLTFFMGFVAAIMNKFGWMSRSKYNELMSQGVERRVPQPTAGQAWRHMAPSKEDLRDLRAGKWERIMPTEADVARANDAVEWASNLSDEEVEKSDYLYNLRTIARLGVVERRTMGYAASTIIAQDKALERVREKASRPESNFVGTVGERIVLTLTLKKVFERQSDWGYTFIQIFEDAAGNEVKWFGSSKIVMPTGELQREGETVTVKATIKKHEEYKGRKQTIISRAAIHFEKVKKTKETKAVAAGIQAAFEAIRAEEDVALGFCCAVAFFLGYQQARHPDTWNRYYNFWDRIEF